MSERPKDDYLALAMGREDGGEVICYMDGVDWECELGLASGGNRLYPSVEDLKATSKCWQQCGIVEVEVRYRKTIHSQDFGNDHDYPEPTP